MSRAIFWVVSGDKFVAMARESARREKQYMPDVARCLITDKKVKGPFTVYTPPDPGGPWYLRSVTWYNWALTLPYKKFVALDADAYPIAPFHEMFTALDRFDFVGVHEGPRVTARTSVPLPDAFAEMNVGSMAFRNNPRVKKMFAHWLSLYKEHQAIYGANEQPALREALWAATGLQIHWMPSAYNCRWHFGSYVVGKVRILHGHTPHIDRIARAVNKDAPTARAFKNKELLRI